jgi:hypothetical protein
MLRFRPHTQQMIEPCAANVEGDPRAPGCVGNWVGAADVPSTTSIHTSRPSPRPALPVVRWESFTMSCNIIDSSQSEDYSFDSDPIEVDAPWSNTNDDVVDSPTSEGEGEDDFEDFDEEFDEDFEETLDEEFERELREKFGDDDDDAEEDLDEEFGTDDDVDIDEDVEEIVEDEE